MAKILIKAGAEFDVLSPQELDGRMDKMAELFEKLTKGQEAQTISQAAAPFLTDSTGGTSAFDGGAAKVYRCPVGYDAFLTRLSVDFEGSNAKSPTSCDVRILADANTPAALRAVNNTVPTVYEASKSHAPMFRGGQHVCVALTAGPTSTQIYVTVQVLLTPRKHIAADILGD